MHLDLRLCNVCYRPRAVCTASELHNAVLSCSVGHVAQRLYPTQAEITVCLCHIAGACSDWW